MERRAVNVSATPSMSSFAFHITPNKNNMIRQEKYTLSNSTEIKQKKLRNKYQTIAIKEESINRIDQ